MDEDRDENQEILYPVLYEGPIEIKPKKKPSLVFLALAVLFLLGGFGIGAGMSMGTAVAQHLSAGGQGIQGSSIHVGSDGVMATALQPQSMVRAVELVKPSVVSINTTVPRPANASRFFDADEAQSSGTGIVFKETDQRYYIVTNEHVIEGATHISVAFSRSDEVEAHVFGRYREADLAVIYVEKTALLEKGISGIKIAEFGNSAHMQIGEVVMAIGNALGQGITTTMGVVSARDIRINIDNRNLHVLQTDATINRGNSGGPLINANGEVIGINTAKVIRDNAVGMGYSITSNTALPIIEMILNEQTPARLGIHGFSLEDLRAGNHQREIDNYGLEELASGVLVIGIQADSGADRGGLQVSDFITHFNGTPVETLDHLRALIAEFFVGDTIQLTILRAGQTQEIEIQFRQW